MTYTDEEREAAQFWIDDYMERACRIGPRAATDMDAILDLLARLKERAATSIEALRFDQHNLMPDDRLGEFAALDCAAEGVRQLPLIPPPPEHP